MHEQSLKHVVGTADGWAEAGVDLHLGEYVLEVVIGLLDMVGVGALVRRHHHALVPRQPLDLLLHAAPLVSAPVVASVSMHVKK